MNDEPKGFYKFVKYIKDHWKEILVGVAGTTLLVLGGIALSKRPKELRVTNSSNTDNSKSNSQKSTDSNPNSIKKMRAKEKELF